MWQWKTNETVSVSALPARLREVTMTVVECDNGLHFGLAVLFALLVFGLAAFFTAFRWVVKVRQM